MGEAEHNSKEAAWSGFDRFSTVQDLLEHNKVLINEINSNHEGRTPEGLARNLVLIRELNSNLAKVVEVYQELSNSFQQLTTGQQSSKEQQQ